MALVTAFLPVESEITASLPYANSSVSSRIHEMFGDFSSIESRLTVAQQTFTMLQTVRTRVDGTSKISSPVVGAIDTDSPSWAVGKTGVNSLIRATIDFGFAAVDGELNERDPVSGFFTVFGRIDQDGAGGGGGALPPLDPGVEIPEGRSYEQGLDFKVFLDYEDLTNQVTNCRISYSRDKFCGEVDISWASSSLFQKLNCLPLSKELRLQIDIIHYTDYWDANGVKSRSITSTKTHRFFLEKRNTSLLFGEHTVSSWGRSKSAIMTTPYAKKYAENLPILSEAIESGSMIQVTDLFKDICDTCGLGVDEISWEILDYQIRPGKFSVVGLYPIEAVQRLAEAVGGIVITDRWAPAFMTKTIRVVYRYPM